MSIDPNFYDRQYVEMRADTNKMYDHAWYKHLHRFSKGRNQVIAEFMKTQGRHYNMALDLGCGVGATLEFMAPFADSYCGFDLSNANLQVAEKRYKNVFPHVNLQQADLNQPLPVEDNSVDLLVTVGTIEYLFDPETFLAEIHRVLQPGGRLIIQTMNLAFVLRRLQLLFGKLPTFNSAAGWQGGVLHNFTIPTFKTLLRSNGFTVEHFLSSGLLPAFRRKVLPNLTCSDMIFVCRKE